MKDEELDALAAAKSQEFRRRVRRMEDFRFDEQQDKFWDVTTGLLLSAQAVNGAIPKDCWPTDEDGKPYPPAKAINDVRTGLTVEGASWWPGRPRYIRNVVVTDRGKLPKKGATTFNLYWPGPPPPEEWETPTLWIEHVKKLYPDPRVHEHFFDFAAHAVQFPGDKVNHGLVMSGAQGIGKDTALLPLRHAVGEWNAAEIGPDDITRQYNGFVRSVLLIVNEVRPHEEDARASTFYNMLKPILAAPPEMLGVQAKYMNTVYVPNLCHVILTTNDPLTMYIPKEDRRLFIMDSPLFDPKLVRVFEDDYFDRLHRWLDEGGSRDVHGWLAARKIDRKRMKEPPPMTEGKRQIITTGTEVRRHPIDDLIDAYLEWAPDATVIFGADLLGFANAQDDLFDDREEVMAGLRRKDLPHKMAARGFRLVQHSTATEWRRKEGRVVKFRSKQCYVRQDVELAEEAARNALSLRPLAFHDEEF